MELFSFHDELIALLLAHEQDCYLALRYIYIVQYAEPPSAQLVLGKGIWTKFPYSLRGFLRLVRKTTTNCRLNGSLILCGQIVKVLLRFLRDRYLKRHQRTSS